MLLNQRESLLNQRTRSVSELNDIDQQIEDFKDHIYALQDLEALELKTYGYNDDQIDAIYTYDGSDAKTLRASASITAYVSNTPIMHRYDSGSNLTYIKQNVTFTVNGVLGWYFKNFAAISFGASNGNTFAPIYSSKVSGTATYRTYSNGQEGPRVYRSVTKLGDDGYNGAYKVSFESRDPSTYGNIYKLSLTTEAHVEGNPSYIIFRYGYGYTSSGLSSVIGLSFSNFGASVGITISPKKYTTMYPAGSPSKTYYR